MDPITELFDRMDTWRHLPNYQLEHRADLFFSPYLPDALQTKLGFPIRAELIPELPLRIGTVYPDTPSNKANKSHKIDYFALSQDSDHAVFVELKTEQESRNPKQDRTLTAAKNIGLAGLLEGLLQIFRVTQSKRKYFCLLEQLEHLGLLQIPPALRETITSSNLQEASAASKEVRITCSTSQNHVVYIQPRGTGPDIITFEEFRTVVASYDDPVSVRFAQSLKEWAGGAGC